MYSLKSVNIALFTHKTLEKQDKSIEEPKSRYNKESFVYIMRPQICAQNKHDRKIFKLWQKKSGDTWEVYSTEHSCASTTNQKKGFGFNSYHGCIISPQLFEHIQTHAMWSGSRTKLNTLENVNDLTCKSLKYKDMISGGWVY